MSNAVSILLLDGVKHGMIVGCVPRPVPPTLEVYAPDATYTTRIFTIAGANYRIALPADNEWSDDTITMHIVAFDWKPSWDLNPPFTERNY